jgi:hypothetical protein
MAYKVVKKGAQYAVVKLGSGDEVGRHPTNVAAQAHKNALIAKMNGEPGPGKVDMRKSRSAQGSRLANAAGRRAKAGTSRAARRELPKGSNNDAVDTASYASTPNEVVNQKGT